MTPVAAQELVSDHLAGAYKRWMLTHGCGVGTASKAVRYIRFLAREKGLEITPPTEESTMDFLAHWREHGVRPKTLNSWVREINCWARFNELDWKMPYFRHYDAPAVRVPDRKLVGKLLELRWIDPVANARNRALIALLADVGPRRNEIIQLDLRDLQLIDDDGHALLTVRHGKGEKGRILPIDPLTYARLQEYIDAYRVPSTASALFTSRTGRLSFGYLGRIIQQAGARVGAPWLSAHKLRHYVVDSLLDLGASVSSVAELMGHARWETTQLYRQKRLAKAQMEREVRALSKARFGGRT